MLFDFLSVEYPVDHMAAKQSHFDLVSSVSVNLLIFMDDLENIRSCGSVCKL